LAATIGDELAARLYVHFVRTTFANVGRFDCGARFATFTPKDKKPELTTLFPGDWKWFEQIPSPDLGERIHHAVATVLSRGFQRVITIGTDSPSMPAGFLDEAAEALGNHDVVLGPAEDGGYYLIGLKAAHEALFREIDWSTEKVLAQTLKNARRLGLRTHLLPTWFDVDDVTSLRRFCQSEFLPSELHERIQPFLN